GLKPLWPAEANMVFVLLPQAMHERLQAAGAHYYVLHTDRSDPANVPAGFVLARLVTSFATTESSVDKFVSLIRSTGCGLSHDIGTSRRGTAQGSSVGQRRPRNVERRKKPRERSAAYGDQRVMDARPSAAHALSPEQRGRPQSQNRAENAEPCEGIEDE